MGSGPQPKDGESIEVEEVVEGLGRARELDGKDRARLTLAYAILGGVLALFLLAGAALLFASSEQTEAAKTLFDFAKSFGPPIVTLVIGFYFRSEGD
jgi:hypothetical protein